MTNPEPTVTRTIEEFVDTVDQDRINSPLFTGKEHMEEVMIALIKSLSTSLDNIHSCSSLADALSYLEGPTLVGLSFHNVNIGYAVFGRQRHRDMLEAASDRLGDEITLSKKEYSCLLARQIIANNQI